MKIYLALIPLALLVAGCHSSPPPASSSNAYAPSPHYSGAPCPSSASSNEGGLPTSTDCVPGGTD